MSIAFIILPFAIDLSGTNAKDLFWSLWTMLAASQRHSPWSIDNQTIADVLEEPIGMMTEILTDYGSNFVSQI